MERETLGQTQNSGRNRSVDMFFNFLWQKVMEFRGIKHDPSDPMDPTPGFLFRSAIPPAVVVKSKVSSCRTCLVDIGAFFRDEVMPRSRRNMKRSKLLLV